MESARVRYVKPERACHYGTYRILCCRVDYADPVGHEIMVVKIIDCSLDLIRSCESHERTNSLLMNRPVGTVMSREGMATIAALANLNAIGSR